MSSGDLRLNSIDRFRKTSGRLILEQHSHCEVPAGCGGVILRWRNPDEGLPVVFACAADAKVELIVNGQVVASRAILPWGENTIAVRLTAVKADRPFLMTVMPDLPEGSGRRDALSDGCTSPDGTWKASSREFENWFLPDFDDSDWATLQELNQNFPAENRWRYDGLQRNGAQPLQIPENSGVVSIRKKLVVRRGTR